MSHLAKRLRKIKDVPSALKWTSGWLNDLKQDWDNAGSWMEKKEASGKINDALKVVERLLKIMPVIQPPEQLAPGGFDFKSIIMRHAPIARQKEKEMFARREAELEQKAELSKQTETNLQSKEISS